jgi:NTP pyrophosphatase (non-canonical NTP hydrolase)
MWVTRFQELPVMDIQRIQEAVDTFVTQRAWEKYHTPKNVAIALSVEVSELLEILQWMSDEDIRQIDKDDPTCTRLREEFGDVMIYLLRFAYLLGIDAEQAVEDKLKLNEEKYPVNISKGDFVKYSERES